MEKQVKKAFGKNIILLGKDKDGKYYWLEEPSWDCGWYWGFGYIETYTNNRNPEKAKDIRSHQHFDSLFLNDPNNNAYEKFKNFFVETPLDDDEIWVLVDLMKSFYTLKETAALLENGNSHYTAKANMEELKNHELRDKINHKMIPAIFKRIENLY